VDEFFAYTGQARDPESGLQQHWHRYYEPPTGRWISVDPIPDDTNLYRYVGNSSTNATDPLGLFVTPDRIIGPKRAVEMAGTGALFVEGIKSLSSPKHPENDLGIGAFKIPGKKTIREEFRKNFVKAGVPASVATKMVKLLEREDVAQFLLKDKTLTALVVNAVSTWAGFTTDAQNAFVFTCESGWIDLGHFWASALAGYLRGEKKALRGGVAVEIIQALTPPIKSLRLDEWHNSMFTVEDLPTDKLGAQFGAMLKKQGRKYSDIQGDFKKVLESWKPIDPTGNPKVEKILKDEAQKLVENKTRHFSTKPWRGEAYRQLCK
jgi:RHS repeat-associated protein